MCRPTFKIKYQTSTFSEPRDFNIGSVCALYLLRVIILKALFCSLDNIYTYEVP